MVVSAADATSTSIWPTPTVSTMTTGNAGRPEDAHGVGHGQGQAAEVPAGGHGADEDGRIEGVLPHADPVAEDRPAAERRGGIDGQHAHLIDRLGRTARASPTGPA